MGKYKDRKSEFKSGVNSNALIGLVEVIIGLGGFIACLFQNFFVAKFFLGLFGIMSYPIFLTVAFFGAKRLFNFEVFINSKLFFYALGDALAIIALLHIIFSFNVIKSIPLGEYLKSLYNLSRGVTFGGLIFGIVPGLIGYLLGSVGAMVLSLIVLTILVGFTIDFIIYNSNQHRLIKTKRVKKFEKAIINEPSVAYNDKTAEETLISDNPNQNEGEQEDKILEIEEDDKEKDDEPSARSILFGPTNLTSNKANKEDNEPKTAREILFGANNSPDVFTSTDQERRQWLEANPVSEESDEEDIIPARDNASKILFGSNYGLEDEPQPEAETFRSRRNPGFNDVNLNDENENYLSQEDFSRARDEIREEFNQDNAEENNEEEPIGNLTFGGRFNERAPRSPRSSRMEQRFATDLTRFSAPSVEESEQEQEETQEQDFSSRLRSRNVEQTEIWQTKKPEKPAKPVVRDVRYNPPPVTLLKENKDDPSKYSKNYEENSRIIEEKLETFKIPAKIINVVRGPSVTRYELTMPSGIPVKKILAYDMDLSMALKTKQTIRIEAPIPGKNAVGIETPNDPRSMVTLRELIESKEFANSTMALPVAIGKDINGEVIVKNLAKMVHVLVAGSTGSGKSVFLHSVIMSLMFKLSPSELRFIMIDPKRVEFSRYRGMPHMMLNDVVSDASKAVNSLQWAVKEMERRYTLLEKNSCQNIAGFNQSEAVKNGDETKLPYIVIIVDELAELMNVAKKEVETAIQRIAQLGRASGIHLVIATQRPSVDVITGTIKANLPNRIAFALTNYIDSKTILDEPGAEKLLGQGDMLFSAQESNTPVRLQAAFVGDDEIDRCVDFIKRNNETNYDEEVMKAIYAEKEDESQAQAAASGKEQVDHSDQMDELLPAALKYFIESKKGSINMVQRRFYVGYSRAARIVDQMEVRGYVSAAEGSKNREILLTMDDFRQIFGDDV